MSTVVCTEIKTWRLMLNARYAKLHTDPLILVPAATSSPYVSLKPRGLHETNIRHITVIPVWLSKGGLITDGILGKLKYK